MMETTLLNLYQTDRTKSLQKQLFETLQASLLGVPELWEWRDINDRSSIRLMGTNVELWVYGGGARLYKPYEVKFTLVQAIYLRTAYRRWLKQIGKVLINNHIRATCVKVIHDVTKAED
jgi:hypothetical protein